MFQARERAQHSENALSVHGRARREVHHAMQVGTASTMNNVCWLNEPRPCSGTPLL